MHIITRQAAAASNIIKNSEIYNKEIPFEIKEENPKESLSPGSGILICATLNKGGIIGSDSLGEKGLSAEKVGEKTAYNLINQIKTGASIDKNMADMIIPFLAFAQGKSKIYIPELTNHTLTNIQIVELMTEIKFRINKESNGLILLEVEGKNLENR